MNYETLGVSRETFARLERYVALLLRWQTRINLISSLSVADVWQRHIADSVQLAQLKPDARVWADLGSGGGLPGLVIACLVRERSGGTVHLVESNAKKAAFLRQVSIDLALPTVVHARRIESAVPDLPDIEVVTARALAPLADLIGYANLLLKSGAVALFPKGADVNQELTEAEGSWHFSYRLHHSRTDLRAKIVELSLV